MGKDFPSTFANTHILVEKMTPHLPKWDVHWFTHVNIMKGLEKFRDSRYSVGAGSAAVGELRRVLLGIDPDEINEDDVDRRRLSSCERFPL